MNTPKKNIIFGVSGMAIAILFDGGMYVYFSKVAGNGEISGNINNGGEVGTTTDISPAPAPVKKAPSLPKYKGEAVEIVKEDQSVTASYPEETKKTKKRELLELAQKLAKNPNDLDNWLQVGVIKKFFGDYNGARDAWEYVNIIRPSNSVSFFNLGGLYALYLRDYPKAEANYKMAIKNSPLDAMYYTALSDLYRNSMPENAGKVLDVMNQGLAVNPDDTGLLVYVAGYYRDTKDYARAIEAYQKVLLQDPSNEAIKNAIEDLKKAMGSTTPAVPE
ncbi:MAG: hypothetical protein A3D57_00700 [Candidatus Sungbacteria bacterium RIFCSPHIGHO2_02_FULL_46_12]|nr:MAG: hypothetical protein A3D57_00700 [Candidatus Sungbacteria bacterium RIFCSPHIGHO2_02_FULL_46_12]